MYESLNEDVTDDEDIIQESSDGEDELLDEEEIIAIIEHSDENEEVSQMDETPMVGESISRSGRQRRSIFSNYLADYIG